MGKKLLGTAVGGCIVVAALMILSGGGWADPGPTATEKKDLPAPPETAVEPGAAPVIADTVPAVVAAVNGVKLKREQLAVLAVAACGRKSLDTLITQELVRQEARKQGVAVTQREIDAHIKVRAREELTYMARKLGFKDLADFLRQNSIDEQSMTKLQREVIKSLHPFIGPDLLVRKMMLKSVKISDADLHQAFTQRYGPKVEVLQILLNTHEEAEEVLQKLKAGAAFSTMVEKVSRDWASSLKGGKMPPLPLSSKLGAAVSRLQPGELSEVVQTPDGFHILKLVKALPMSPVRLEDVRDRLREESTEKTLRDQRNNWLKDLRLTADIQRHY